MQMVYQNLLQLYLLNIKNKLIEYLYKLYLLTNIVPAAAANHSAISNTVAEVYLCNPINKNGVYDPFF